MDVFLWWVIGAAVAAGFIEYLKAGFKAVGKDVAPFIWWVTLPPIAFIAAALVSLYRFGSWIPRTFWLDWVATWILAQLCYELLIQWFKAIVTNVTLGNRKLVLDDPQSAEKPDPAIE